MGEAWLLAAPLLLLTVDDLAFYWVAARSIQEWSAANL